MVCSDGNRDLSASASPTAGGSPSGQRSRAGCWTCKRRHKKCDELRPACKRCSKAGMVCEGYGRRLTWGPTHTETASASGTFLYPVRTGRRRNKAPAVHRSEGPEGGCLEMHKSMADLSELHVRGFLREEINALCFQYADEEYHAANSPADEDTESKLIQRFISHGHLTLTGRSGSTTLFGSSVLPLLENCITLQQVCIAYQTGLEETYQYLTPIYLQATLSQYLLDICDKEKLGLDETLITGVLLCSVSITALHIWTPLLRGLRWLLEQRGLLASPRTPLTDHMVEVIALLDMPHANLNSTCPSQHLWRTYVAPLKKQAVEEVSGLPYSLINILADLDVPNIEIALLQWPGEHCQDLIQVHFWESFRSAGILHARALQLRRKANSCSEHLVPRTPTSHLNTNPSPSDDIMVSRTFAAIQAIMQTNSPSVGGGQPLDTAYLYPAFIAGLYTKEGSRERAFALETFRALVSKTRCHRHEIIMDVMAEVWQRRMKDDSAHSSVIDLATDIAVKRNIELHLY
ncbi:hypothetical protein BX600DRAFT_473903 [Xylariales sp. PMI_506]|nr:hypothetical protein BX600DRAFT_473903 [Xylariales sp. PMI_506]